MRVLGLDPGLRHTGWGVIDVTGNRLTHIADGAVHAATDLPLAMRLVSLFRQITSVIERFQPDEAAVEETFVNRNPGSSPRTRIVCRVDLRPGSGAEPRHYVLGHFEIGIHVLDIVAVLKCLEQLE